MDNSHPIRETVVRFIIYSWSSEEPSCEFPVLISTSMKVDVVMNLVYGENKILAMMEHIKSLIGKKRYYCRYELDGESNPQVCSFRYIPKT